MWLEFWRVQETLTETPAKDRKAEFGKTMVDPVLRLTIESAATYEKERIKAIGTVGHETRWGPSVDGRDEAAMADCQDQSEFGIFDVAGEQLLSHGPKRANVHGTFKRTEQGWKVQAFITVETKC